VSSRTEEDYVVGAGDKYVLPPLRRWQAQEHKGI